MPNYATAFVDVYPGAPRRAIVLDEARIVNKIVREHRGGFCYELNSRCVPRPPAISHTLLLGCVWWLLRSFGWLLRQLGFSVERLSARMNTIVCIELFAPAFMFSYATDRCLWHTGARRFRPSV